MIDTLPAPGGAMPLADGGEPGATAALAQAVETYLHGRYRLRASRYFALDADRTTWVAIEKQAAQDVAAAAPQAHQESFNWHRVGYDTIAVWALTPEWKQHVAVALAREPLPDGRRLVGYFALDSD